MPPMFKTEIMYQNPLSVAEIEALSFLAMSWGASVNFGLSQDGKVLSLYTPSKELGWEVEYIINTSVVNYGPQCLITPPHPCNEI